MLVCIEMNVSFFVANDDRSVISVDIEAIHRITIWDFLELSKAERDFVKWFNSQTLRGLRGLSIVGGSSEIQNSSQEQICEEFIRMINSPTLEDPDIF